MPDNPQEAVAEVVTQADEACASQYVKKPAGFIDGEYPDRCSFDHASLSVAFARHRRLATEAAEAECARLRKMLTGEWFYPPDGYESKGCHYSPDEVIDYIDLPPGEHVIEVNVATPLPSIWCAVSVTSDEDADERYTFTEHASEDAAKAALTKGAA